jgi:hypothetical protein
MFLTLNGNELEAQEDCRQFVLDALCKTYQNAKDIIDTSETPFQVYAYRYDAGMVGTSGIRFIISNDTEEQILDNLWDELGEHVENYSYTWHVNYEAETDEESDPYQEEYDKHKENAMHMLELYDPAKHHGKIPGGYSRVQFELLY